MIEKHFKYARAFREMLSVRNAGQREVNAEKGVDVLGEKVEQIFKKKYENLFPPLYIRCFTYLLCAAVTFPLSDYGSLPPLTFPL